jgi:hypothetical protein
MSFTFPFGQPVTPRPPTASSPRRVLVLGAYPSALHIEWKPPAPYKRIAALAVDDEPTPFWTGDDEAARVERWSAAVGFRASWGTVRGVGRLNGSSGVWVEREVLRPLGVTHAETWITDCLDTYRASTGAGRRLADTYEPFARAFGLTSAVLPPHPDEEDIVREARADHLGRLRSELRSAKPELIVTLGNAALRVLRELVEADHAPARLNVATYATRLPCRFEGRAVAWLPLAHPAAPAVYQGAHARWQAGLR